MIGIRPTTDSTTLCRIAEKYIHFFHGSKVPKTKLVVVQQLVSFYFSMIVMYMKCVQEKLLTTIQSGTQLIMNAFAVVDREEYTPATLLRSLACVCAAYRNSRYFAAASTVSLYDPYNFPITIKQYKYMR